MPSGTCHVLYTFDLGQSIAVQKAAALAEGRVLGSEPYVHRHDLLRAEGPGVPPLRLRLEGDELEVLGFRTTPDVRLSLHPFGAAVLRYEIPLDHPLEELPGLTAALYEAGALAEDARLRIEHEMSWLAGAITQPGVAPPVEDYWIICLRPSEETAPERLPRETLARILRAEPGRLSADEVDAALSARIAYGPQDATWIDWLGTVTVGEHPADELRVLELANVELLEMRLLDARLERAVEESWALISRKRRGWAHFRTRDRDLEHLGRLQVDAALLQDGSASVLKIIGDDYVARLHHLAARRLHLDLWNQSISGKVQALSDIQARLSDRAAHRRAEVLETIIILLIALEIVLYVLE